MKSSTRALACVSTHKRFVLPCALLLPIVVAGLVPGCSGGTSDTDPGGGECVYKEAGTNFAPCQTDSDCLSAFCDTSESPPYCYIPTHSARAELHGYDCTSNADCEAVGSDLVARGGVAECVNDMIYAGCSFYCTNGMP
jgi:hypothetical protein